MFKQTTCVYVRQTTTKSVVWTTTTNKQLNKQQQTQQTTNVICLIWLFVCILITIQVRLESIGLYVLSTIALNSPSQHNMIKRMSCAWTTQLQSKATGVIFCRNTSSTQDMLVCWLLTQYPSNMQGDPLDEMPHWRRTCRWHLLPHLVTLYWANHTVQNKLRTNCSQTCQRQSFELNDLKF